MSYRAKSYTATFYDGQSAHSHRVTLTLEANQLRLEAASLATAITWPYAEIEVRQAPQDGLPAVVSHPSLPGSQLIVSPDIFAKIKPYLPRQTRPYKVAAGGIAFLSVVVLTVLWVIPLITPALAEIFPTAWERKLGRIVYSQLVTSENRCTQVEATKALHTMVNTLTSGTYLPPVKITIVKSDMINAFALPSGNIIVHTELIEQAATPEELLGVLAHEMGHLSHNHIIENLIQQLGTLGILDVATGGGGTMIYLLNEFYQQSYSRDYEREADEFAAEHLTKQGYHLKGLIAFFKRLEKQSKNQPEWLQWLSTHPADAERIQFFQNYPASATKAVQHFEKEWVALKKLGNCTHP